VRGFAHSSSGCLCGPAGRNYSPLRCLNSAAQQLTRANASGGGRGDASGPTRFAQSAHPPQPSEDDGGGADAASAAPEAPPAEGTLPLVSGEDDDSQGDGHGWSGRLISLDDAAQEGGWDFQAAAEADVVVDWGEEDGSGEAGAEAGAGLDWGADIGAAGPGEGSGSGRPGGAGRVYPLGGVGPAAAAGGVDAAFLVRSRPAGEEGSSDETDGSIDEDEEDDGAVGVPGHVELWDGAEEDDGVALADPDAALDDEPGEPVLAVSASSRRLGMPDEPSRREPPRRELAAHTTWASVIQTRPGRAAGLRRREPASMSRMDAVEVDDDVGRAPAAAGGAADGEEERRYLVRSADGRVVGVARVVSRPAPWCGLGCVFDVVRLLCCCIMPAWMSDAEEGEMEMGESDEEDSAAAAARSGGRRAVAVGSAAAP